MRAKSVAIEANISRSNDWDGLITLWLRCSVWNPALLREQSCEMPDGVSSPTADHDTPSWLLAAEAAVCSPLVDLPHDASPQEEGEETPRWLTSAETALEDLLLEEQLLTQVSTEPENMRAEPLLPSEPLLSSAPAEPASFPGSSQQEEHTEACAPQPWASLEHTTQVVQVDHVAAAELTPHARADSSPPPAPAPPHAASLASTQFQIGPTPSLDAAPHPERAPPPTPPPTSALLPPSPSLISSLLPQPLGIPPVGLEGPQMSHQVLTLTSQQMGSHPFGDAPRSCADTQQSAEGTAASPGSLERDISSADASPGSLARDMSCESAFTEASAPESDGSSEHPSPSHAVAARSRTAAAPSQTQPRPAAAAPATPSCPVARRRGGVVKLHSLQVV